MQHPEWIAEPLHMQSFICIKRLHLRLFYLTHSANRCHTERPRTSRLAECLCSRPLAPNRKLELGKRVSKEDKKIEQLSVIACVLADCSLTSVFSTWCWWRSRLSRPTRNSKHMRDKVDDSVWRRRFYVNHIQVRII